MLQIGHKYHLNSSRFNPQWQKNIHVMGNVGIASNTWCPRFESIHRPILFTFNCIEVTFYDPSKIRFGMILGELGMLIFRSSDWQEEMKHCDWLLKVTWLVLTNHTALFQHVVATLFLVKFVYDISCRSEFELKSSFFFSVENIFWVFFTPKGRI